MSRARVVVAGGLLGLLGLYIWRAQAARPVDTATGEGGGLLSGADGFLDMAFQAGAAIMPGQMEISLAGLDHIKRLEGYSATVYKDIAGFWTGGYGHKLAAWEPKTERTEAEWARVLASDVTTAEAAVNRLVTVALTQYQFDALVSFVYNVGAGAFARSTMLKLLNAGDYAGALGQFGRWVYAGGKASEGLRNRRVAEANLFKGIGSYTA